MGLRNRNSAELPPDVSDLFHFVGEDSWSFFKILRLGHTFLNDSVDQWEENSDWRRAKGIVDVLRVANDAAE